jgi:diguanylate cyclase (GGDEF)-like protein
VRTRHDGAVVDLVAALEDVRRQGGARDEIFVGHALVAHTAYLSAAHRLFDAVDRGEPDQAERMDAEEVDPLFAAISSTILNGAERQHQAALTALAELQEVEETWLWLTPAGLGVGLALGGVLVWTIVGHRRRLETERARATYGALHDALTGLANRTLLNERFERTLAVDASCGTRSGLLLIDLDRFKEINDTFGHHYGDELLRQVGERLTSVLSEQDTVARLGGDEFAVLLPDAGSVAGARLVARRLLTALEMSFHVEGVDLNVEASIGVVLGGEHGVDATTLLQRADVAMYIAKAEQSGVATYDPTVDEHSPARLSLLGDLRRGLDRGEIVLHYQPKIRIADGAVVGAEALVRWQHPERGLIYPGDFIPLAEHTGLIGPLTLYVLDAALAQARLWADDGQPMTVSVNLSARNLLDARLPRQVAELLDVHDIDPWSLELEVTETAIVTDVVRVRRLLEQLTALGIRISLDDFGAGSTSLSQLSTMPLSELKIDRCLVSAMTVDVPGRMIVRSIVELGHHLGLTIVAEGVETAETLAMLVETGCDVAQGYHLSRPLTVEAFSTWSAGRHVHAATRPVIPSPRPDARDRADDRHPLAR